MVGKSILEIKVGDTASLQKTITENDVYLFTQISGDYNLAHIDPIYAMTNLFKDRVVHGLLTASLISAVLGTQLPGPGTIYLSQDCKFLKPVKFNDTIKATVEVIEISLEKNQVKLLTICTNQNEDIVIRGMATVMPPKFMNI